MKKAKKNKLAQYLEDEGIMQKSFAAKIGISAPSLLAILRGEVVPRLDVALLIEEMTYGKVKANKKDWLLDSDKE